MTDLQLYIVYAVIIILSVAVTSITKYLVKKYGTKSDDVSTAMEYIFSAMSFILSAGFNFILLRFGGGYTNAGYLTVMTLLAGTSTYIVYLLLFQSTRKIGLAVLKSVMSKISGGTIVDIAESKEATEEQAEAVAEAVSSSDNKIQEVISLLKK